jgi:hypothetical protein
MAANRRRGPIMHGNVPLFCEFGRALFLNARWYSSRIFRWGASPNQRRWPNVRFRAHNGLKSDIAP